MDLEQHVDRLLSSVRFPFPLIRFDRPYPPINVYELDDEYLVVVQLPGVGAESLELTVHDGLLVLKGHRNGPTGVQDERYRRHERIFGGWERTIPLPDRVKEERVSAEFNNGRLLVHLPKVMDVRSRTIRVTAGDTPSPPPG
jgi:HSP20 family protein